MISEEKLRLQMPLRFVLYKLDFKGTSPCKAASCFCMILLIYQHREKANDFTLRCWRWLVLHLKLNVYIKREKIVNLIWNLSSALSGNKWQKITKASSVTFCLFKFWSLWPVNSFGWCTVIYDELVVPWNHSPGSCIKLFFMLEKQELVFYHSALQCPGSFLPRGVKVLSGQGLSSRSITESDEISEVLDRILMSSLKDTLLKRQKSIMLNI